MKKGISLMLAGFMMVGSMFSAGSPMTAKAGDSFEALVKEMPMEQKVAQMLMPSFRYWGTGDDKKGVTELNDAQKAVLTKYNFGGVILFGQNTQNAVQTTELINSMQEANLKGGAKSSLFVAIDQEGGYITRLNTGTQMPGSMAISATGDTNNAYLVAKAVGKELAVQGLNVNFAPDMDVNNNPANPIIGVRSFSDNPDVVSAYGAKYIEGLHDNGVLVALKHFPGHGDTDTDSHTGLPLINKNYEQLKKLELIPFESAAHSADFIMTAHIQYPNIEKQTYVSKASGEKIYLPATLSKTILTDCLRKDLGFDGLIVTDAMDMDAIAENFDPMDSARFAINAGANMILMPVDLSTNEGIANLDKYINGVVAQIKAGQISENRVNDSVYRILKMKAKYGLMHDDKLNIMKKSSRITPSALLAEKTVGCKAHHDLEWEVALQAVTSVKNDNAYPISADKKVVVLYPRADQKNSIEYALDKLGADGVKVNKDNVKAVLTKDAKPEDITSAVDGADVVIMISAIYSAEISNADLVHSLIKKTHDNGGKFVFLSAQLPYDMAQFTEADSLVACYSAKGMPEIPTGAPNTKQYGANLPAALYAIFGGYNPRGTLPVKLQ